MEMIVFIALLIIAGKAIAKHQVQKEEQDRRYKIEQARRMAKLQREQVIQAQEQARQAKEQERLAKEQEKQAEIIRKHDEKLRKLAEKASIAEITHDYYEPIVDELRYQLECAEAKNEIENAKRIKKQLYQAELKLVKACNDMEAYDDALEQDA